MKYIRFEIDENDPREQKAKRDKDGKMVYICPKCDKRTADIVAIYHGTCHGVNPMEGSKQLLDNEK